MLLDRMRDMDDLTSNERVFVNYVLLNRRSIIDLSIHEIAAENYISASTIVRFCKKLGFSGYLQFKSQYISEFQESLRLDMTLKERPFSADATVDEVIHNLPLIYYRSVDFAKSSIDKETIMRCMEYIHQSDQILIFGNGINLQLAEIFAYKMREVGKNVVVSDSSHFQAMELLRNKPETAFAILLSHSGTNVMIHDVARRLGAIGVKKLLISSGREDSIIRPLCEEHLQIIKTKSTLEFSNTIYSISMKYILDVFVALVLVDNYDEIDSLQENPIMWM